MNTREMLVGFALAASTLVVGGVAEAQGYPWRNHDGNYPFLFGNDFDTHQQSRLTPSGGLAGFLYVRYAGELTADGYPLARHADCGRTNDCRVGWIMRGEPGRGTLAFHAMGDHPTWQVERSDIPQPGAYGHFHFLGEPAMTAGDERDGYFLELQAIDRFCFLHHDGAAASGTCAERGGVPVHPGIDIATHVNIVGSAPMHMPR